MLIAIRTDANRIIGSGHLMRCLAIADELRIRGQDVVFIMRDAADNAFELVERKKYELYSLPRVEQSREGIKQADGYAQWLGVPWEVDARQVQEIFAGKHLRINSLLVDHYGIGGEWEDTMRRSVGAIMVIDDLANRRHNCDILLDQNYYRENAENRYDGLVPAHCQKFLGPKYALLRDEFYRAQKKMRHRDGSVCTILIAFGGADATNETLKALKAVQRIKKNDVHVDVIAGGLNPHRKSLEEFCAGLPNTIFYAQIDNMSELLVQADLAIGAGGIMTWERCFLGVPSMVIAVAKNQIGSSVALAEDGIIWNLGLKENVSEDDIVTALEKVIDDAGAVKKMSDRAASLMKDNPLSRKILLDSIAGMGG